MQSPPGPETVIDGRKYLYFGGTSYLGLAGHPEIIEAGCDAMRKYGVHSATTRAGMGTIPPVQAVEKLAAKFFGTEDAFYFTSGYASNHILIATLAQDADAVLIDERIHYSGKEAARLAGIPVIPFRSRDPEDLGLKVSRIGKPLVLFDGVCASTGQLAPVKAYMEALQNSKGGTLLVDDAHGFGVLGKDGRGLLDEAGLWQHANTNEMLDGVRLFVGGTLSKALGGYGGIIPGRSAFLNQVKARSHYFDGASAPASASAGATAKALELLMENPELRSRLQTNTRKLRKDLQSLGLPAPDGITAHFGVTTGNAAHMRHIHESLKSRGILVPYLSAYSGTPLEGVLRFAVFANHTKDQLDRLVAELRSLL